MSKIKGKNTSIEKIMKDMLYHNGYHYITNCKNIIGHPDIVITKYKIAIFCDGDFFHGYDLKKIDEQLKTNKDFWLNKIKRNQKRDQIVNQQLVDSGYMVLRFWEHEIKDNPNKVFNEIDMAISKRELDFQE